MIKLPSKIFSKIFPKIVPQSCLGIDIGTSIIKIVGLSKIGARVKLDNYGETSVLTLYEKPFRTFEKSTLLLSASDIAKAIQAICQEAKIKVKKATFSLPDFSSFFTNFELPPMTKKEISQAVKYAAPQYIPLPLSEVTIDWQVIGGKIADKKGTKLKMLLVAVPNDAINQYREIARISNLEIKDLEAEVFSLVRSVIKDTKRTISLIDIGAQSTTISIIDEGLLKISHSFDTAGNELTQQLAKSLDIDFKKAEELKKRYGLREIPDSEAGEEKDLRKIAKILSPLIDSVLNEIKRTCRNFSQTDKKEIEKIILAGGSALLPGLKEHATSFLKKEVEIANPFSEISYPPILDKNLKEMGPSYAIAVGAALRGLE